MPDTVQSILEHLVAIPSVNPEHAGLAEHQGEGRMADALETLLAARGFRVERLEVTPGRPNLIARAGSKSPRRRFCFEAHMDTVAVVGMTVAPFIPAVADGRLYGRGACDTKGPMAAALASLTPERIAAAEAAGCELIFVAAMGEETGLDGACEVAASGFTCDAAVVLEPTNLRPVVAHKGACWMRYTLLGKSGHASTPAGTVNAIRAAAEFVMRVQDAHDASPSSHLLLGASTLNVGRIHGGSAPNIVAGSCSVDLDRRFLPDESVDAIRRDWVSLLETMVTEGKLVGFTVDDLGVTKPLVPAESSSIQEAVQHILETRGRDGAPLGSAWCSDAVPMAEACPDVMVFGPGDIAQAHTADEFIDLGELELGTEILGELVDAWIAAQGKEQA